MFKTTYRKKYNYIIIGSGPSAFASLYAFSKQKIKLGIFIGYKKNKIGKNLLCCLI